MVVWRGDPSTTATDTAEAKEAKPEEEYKMSGGMAIVLFTATQQHAAQDAKSAATALAAQRQRKEV